MKFPKLKNKAILAPMSGVTDIAFRELARKYSASLTYTEFIHSKAILHNNNKTNEMLKISKLEKPSAVQIFGNSESDILEAAKLLENKFDIIDINCGCPAYKVIKTGAGSALLDYPDKIQSLIEKLVKEIKKPITIKIRSGVKEVNALKIAKIAEQAGISTLTLHARTQKQGYSGTADWNLIKKVKEQANIPIIGNGDISSPEQFKEKLEFSKVDYIMIGRASIGNPYLFQQINDFLKTGKYKQKSKEIQFKEYLKLAIKYNLDFSQIKNQAIYFTKGMENSAKLRNSLVSCKNIEEIKNLFKLS
ncbi:tRNA dihydrouridine synthase DusB [Candidatus Woesearchaeota archaeon]|nr:tRNA dihydrouridine synthase DusB [Candidatus Woesearchaeota archaeon]